MIYARQLGYVTLALLVCVALAALLALPSTNRWLGSASAQTVQPTATVPPRSSTPSSTMAQPGDPAQYVFYVLPPLVIVGTIILVLRNRSRHP